MSLYDDTLELLQEMIRNACVNDGTPDSGFEVRNADTLERFFEGTDVAIERFEPHPNRVSIAFTVDGLDPDAEPLTLLGHTDVVPIDQTKWTVAPFGAEIKDGKIYGRGSVDMLFITATMAAVTRDAARRGTRGTLTFVGLADEEARAGLGADWIATHRPDAFSWKNCLSETGGSHLPARDGSDALTVNVGEMGAAQRRLTVSGDAGHGSTPYGKDSAILKISEVARRIAKANRPMVQAEAWQVFVESFKFDPETEESLLTGTGDFNEFGDLAAYADAFAHTTIAPTILRSGGTINVLPSTAVLELDIRQPVGVSQDDVDAMLIDALGDLADEVTISRLLADIPTVSPTEGPLWDAITDTFAEFFPDTPIVPVFSSGGSDLRYARKQGGVGYGFALHARERTLAKASEQLHSHDEHLYLEDLDLTVRAYDSLVRKFVG